MKILHKLSLDMQQSSTTPRFYAKQGDSLTREVEIKLYNGGTEWPVPADATILQIAFGKLDRTGGCYDTLPDGTAACTKTGNTVTAKLHPQVLTCAGTVKCELRLCDAAGLQLSTFIWYIEVEAAADSGVKSQDYWHFTTLESLWAAIGDLTALKTAAKNTVIAAVNELVDNIGTVSNLNTVAKNNLVAAINEVLAKVGALKAKDIPAQLHYDGGPQTVAAALEKLESWIGNLNTLNTSTKTSLVAAINSVLSSTGGGSVGPLDEYATKDDVNALIDQLNGALAGLVDAPEAQEVEDDGTA